MKTELNTELFRAIKSMDIKNLNAEDKKELLNIFNFTQNAAIRDQIALIFADTHYHEAVPYIIKKINDKTVFNHTGTLVYALEGLESKEYFIELIHIICEQAYESKAMAYTIVRKLIPLIPTVEIRMALKILSDCKEKIGKSKTRDEDAIDIIDSTINLFDKGITPPG